MKNILLIGTGPMAIEYVKVLSVFSKNIIVIGRGEESAKKFKDLTNIKPITGGVENYLQTNDLEENSLVIVATGLESLLSTTLLLLKSGADRVLVEKPAAISIDELLENEKELKPFYNKLFIAYNRRYYGSVNEAKKIIEKDQGLLSIHFEFTEWSHKIEPLKKAKGVKENWFFANSTHVVDLAFYLAGTPTNWKAFSKAGELNWHPKTNFAGAGETSKGALFSYMSNWESAGRWSIELLTKKRRIYLKPLEKVFLQDRGSINLVEHPFNESLDKEFKPGLYKQVEFFIKNDLNNLLSIENHILNTKNIYNKILND